MTTLLLSGLGALVGLDRTAFGQTLLAHPFVATALAGALAGDPAAGLLAGLTVFGLSAPVVPVGERTLRDWSSAGVVFGGLTAIVDDPVARGVALLWTLPVAYFGGSVILRVRGIAGVVAERRRGSTSVLDGLEASHLRLTALHGLRGALVVGLGVWGGEALCRGVAEGLDGAEARALELLWRVAPLVGLPLLLRFHLGLARPGWIALGLVLGALIVWGAPPAGGLR